MPIGCAAVGALSLFTGVMYALFGSLVAIWVGEAHAPSPLGYALAGGAIFWLGYRIPNVIFHRLARQLNWAAGLNLGKPAIANSICTLWLRGGTHRYQSDAWAWSKLALHRLLRRGSEFSGRIQQLNFQIGNL